MALERLQKVLSRAGLAARRKAEAFIVEGRVRVDGEVVTALGTKVDPSKQRIEVDGRRIQAEHLCYGILHKPRGMVTTISDPEGRPTAQDILREVGVRVVPIGRLDFNTSGALLFSNDGDFAQALSHARGGAPKVYAAKVQKIVAEEDLERFRDSIEIDGRKTRPAEVRILRREGDKTWLEVTLHEGRNRQVHRLGEHAGIEVVRLARLSHAGVTTEGLRPGQWRLLTTDELRELKQKYGVPKKIHEPWTPQKPSRAGASRSGPSRAGTSRSSASRSGPSRAGASRAGASRVGGSRASADSRRSARGSGSAPRTKKRS